jgi:hypothetical protein
MFNPLLPDLSSLKNEDIDNKINELMRKYSIAARSGQGAVCQQLIIIIETYKAEQQQRHIKSSQKLLDQGKNLDDFINIDH